MCFRTHGDGSWVFLNRRDGASLGERKNPPPDSLQAVGLETWSSLLSVSALAGSARSLSLNNGSGRRRGSGRHRESGANRDGERQHTGNRLATERETVNCKFANGGARC